MGSKDLSQAFSSIILHCIVLSKDSCRTQSLPFQPLSIFALFSTGKTDRCVPLCLSLPWVLRIWTQIPMLTRQTLYPLGHLSIHQPCLYMDVSIMMPLYDYMLVYFAQSLVLISQLSTLHMDERSIYIVPTVSVACLTSLQSGPETALHDYAWGAIWTAKSLVKNIKHGKYGTNMAVEKVQHKNWREKMVSLVGP